MRQKMSDEKKDQKFTRDQAAAIMPKLKGLKVEIIELKGGISNKLYRVKASDGGDYVFRLYGERTEMFVDRDIEMKAMQSLQPLNISPGVVVYLPEKRVTVIEFIDAITLKNEDFLKEDLWEKIIRPIRIIHNSNINISKVFDPIEEVRRFYNIFKDMNLNYPEFDIEGIINILAEIDKTAAVPRDDFVLCHNDLLADNFMLNNNKERSGEPMFIIDWEYAGMSTPYYEIADMFQEILVPRDIEIRLLEIYWGNRDMEKHVYMTDLFKPFPDTFWFLWSMIQLNTSKIKFDYYNYGKEKFENALVNVDYLRENYQVKI
jgi:thiamine kinase-like enzyme